MTTAADDRSDSLLGALSKARISADNHAFIARATTAIGIAGYQAVVNVDKPYVRAMRRDGPPDLHIHYGYTTGFVSEDEVVHFAGNGASRGPSSRKGTWYVAHPTNQVRPGGDRARDIRREAGFCGTCYVQLPLTGICGECG